MSDATAVEVDEAPPPKKRGLLNTIERVGDKVPHPAIIFLALCAIVIVLSHILYLFDVSATQEIAEPVPVETQVHTPAGSVVHELVPLDGDEQALYEEHYEIHTETIPIKSLLNGDGIRFLFTSPVANFNGFGVVGVILVAMVGVGVAEQSGSSPRSSASSSDGRRRGRSPTSSFSSACSRASRRTPGTSC